MGLCIVCGDKLWGVACGTPVTASGEAAKHAISFTNIGLKKMIKHSESVENLA